MAVDIFMHFSILIHLTVYVTLSVEQDPRRKNCPQKTSVNMMKAFHVMLSYYGTQEDFLQLNSVAGKPIQFYTIITARSSVPCLNENNRVEVVTGNSVKK